MHSAQSGGEARAVKRGPEGEVCIGHIYILMIQLAFMKAILIILAAILLLMAVDAKLPKLGDEVSVVVGGVDYRGVIEGMGDGFLCMNNTNFLLSGLMTPESKSPHTCFGIGQIQTLRWIGKSV
jgi:hypothetical protein